MFDIFVRIFFGTIWAILMAFSIMVFIVIFKGEVR